MYFLSDLVFYIEENIWIFWTSYSFIYTNFQLYENNCILNAYYFCLRIYIVPGHELGFRVENITNHNIAVPSNFRRKVYAGIFCCNYCFELFWLSIDIINVHFVTVSVVTSYYYWFLLKDKILIIWKIKRYTI